MASDGLCCGVMVGGAHREDDGHMRFVHNTSCVFMTLMHYNAFPSFTHNFWSFMCIYRVGAPHTILSLNIYCLILHISVIECPEKSGKTFAQRFATHLVHPSIDIFTFTHWHIDESTQEISRHPSKSTYPSNQLIHPSPSNSMKIPSNSIHP